MKRIVLIISIILITGAFWGCNGSHSSANENHTKIDSLEVIDSMSNELEKVSNNLQKQAEAVEQSLDTLLKED